MAQIFSRYADQTLHLALVAILGGGTLLTVIGAIVVRSDYATLKGWVVEQPVPFSHQHHVGGLKIDCQYCHTAVADSALATLPATETCMTCHSQIWTDAQILEPIRQSLARYQPIRWNRVGALPDYVYFRHDAHVHAGVGCVECHGRVDTMPLLRRAQTFQMQWCLDCHRDPAPHLRPRESVTDLNWRSPQDQRELGEGLIQAYHLNVRELSDCNLCHR